MKADVEPIGHDPDGTPMYAQATMELPDGRPGTIVADTPPEVADPEAEAG